MSVVRDADLTPSFHVDERVAKTFSESRGTPTKKGSPHEPTGVTNEDARKHKAPANLTVPASRSTTVKPESVHTNPPSRDPA